MAQIYVGKFLYKIRPEFRNLSTHASVAQQEKEHQHQTWTQFRQY